MVLFARFPIGNYQKENGYKAHRVPFLLFSFRKTKKGKTSGATGVSQTTTARVTDIPDIWEGKVSFIQYLAKLVTDIDK